MRLCVVSTKAQRVNKQILAVFLSLIVCCFARASTSVDFLGGCLCLAFLRGRGAEGAKFHELPILLIFGPGLQIIIYLVILASKARHANLIDTTGGRGRRPRPL